MSGCEDASTRLQYRRVTIDEAMALVQETVSVHGPRVPGYPDEGTRFFALRMLERDPGDDDVFAMYHVVERATGALAGHIGFKGAPDLAGSVRIGYAIVSGVRRRGYAVEAVQWLLGLANAHPGVRTVRADTDRGNVASQRVLERSGFALVRREAATLFYEACRERESNPHGVAPGGF